MFFIPGTGRSGTQWLARILNEDERSAVFHEPDFHEDTKVMSAALNNPRAALEYVKEFRKYRIARRIKKNQQPVYGEVTGTLTYHCAALKRVFPDAVLLLSTLDGRDVLRSIWGRPFYKEKSTGAFNLEPTALDPFRIKWRMMFRFEKLRRAWIDSHQRLLACISPDRIVYFEKLIHDYRHFEERLLKSIGVCISCEQWERKAAEKSDNATLHYAFSHWTEWPTEHKVTFNRICKDTSADKRYLIVAG